MTNAPSTETVVHVISVNPADPREDRLLAAVEVLRAGGLVALPTETFYGLAADAASPEALNRVNRVKGKPADSPILLLASDRAQVEQVSAAPPAPFGPLAEAFWPGPLTLVLPAAPGLPAEVSGGRGTVGVRVPGLALPRRLAHALGRPIAGVSANLYGEPPARTAGEVVDAFPEGLDLVLDGGPTAGGLPSSLVDLVGARPRLLREGIVPRSALEPLLPDLRRESATRSS